MLSSEEIIRTVEMLKSENLDVRTVTLGVSLRDCAGASAQESAIGSGKRSGAKPGSSFPPANKFQRNMEFPSSISAYP